MTTISFKEMSFYYSHTTITKLLLLKYYLHTTTTTTTKLLLLRYCLHPTTIKLLLFKHDLRHRSHVMPCHVKSHSVVSENATVHAKESTRA